MHALDESHILLFLVQLSLLLAVARTLGAICEELGVPALAGEILAGVVLGPTLLGRVAPGLHAGLFPADPIQNTMLETLSWLGVFFLLLASGFHVDIGKALRTGRAAVVVALVGVAVPMVIGVPLFLNLDPSYRGPGVAALPFALFLGVAASIAAIAVVARALGDLGLARSPEGNIALSASAIIDLTGWLLFSVVLSIATTSGIDPLALGSTFFGTVAFVFVCIAVGRTVLGTAVAMVKRTSLSQPAAIQTLIVSVGLLCGIITHLLGIHAILGFFLAGSVAGTVAGISDELRESFSETMHAIFVPLFFATLGLQVDFVTGIELQITALFTVVAVGGKSLGAWLGARLGGIDQGRAVLFGLIFIPGGAMEIVLATLAMELGLIDQRVFVAIVFAALVSSVVAGPLVGLQARRLGLSPVAR